MRRRRNYCGAQREGLCDSAGGGSDDDCRSAVQAFFRQTRLRSGISRSYRDRHPAEMRCFPKDWSLLPGAGNQGIL